MSDADNSGNFRPSQGSLTGFDSVKPSNTDNNLAVLGVSATNLMDYLRNQNDLNFPSPDWILSVQQQILDHISDHNNPHKTTLAQIEPDFTGKILGAIVPGTVPETIPFYSFDARYELPLGTIFPATYTSSNIYRQTSGGWLVNPSQEADVIGTDYISNRAGIPLFSGMTNIVPSNWDSTSNTLINTAIGTLVDPTINYPFAFKEITETPNTGLFGFDIPMTQGLQVAYTTSFFVKPSLSLGKLRIYQPSDPATYMEVNLTDGSFAVYSDVMTGNVVRYVSGVLRISLNYISKNPTPDNKLRIVHLNTGATGDGTRTGSLGRKLFSIANPITTRAALDQPAMIDLTQPASTSTFVPKMTAIGFPATLQNVTVSMALTLHPSSLQAPVTDPTIMTFGNLIISRDQRTIRVAVNGVQLFSTPILEGYNVITLSYAADKLVFKDLANPRQEATGTFAPLSTSTISFGPFGGYLNNVAFYAQSDTSGLVEFLNNA